MPDEVKTDENDLIEKAATLARRLEAANKRAEELLAKQILAGRSEAGTPPPKLINPDDAAKERINNMLKSTGLKI